MPRCYMVKKALCNKYINNVSRSFDGWNTRCNTSPTPLPEPSNKLLAPKPRYASFLIPGHTFTRKDESTSVFNPISNLSSKEHMNVAEGTHLPLNNFETTNTTTIVPITKTAVLIKDVKTIISGPTSLENTCTRKMVRSPDRPPRSIEQPLAKSAFSRPKQTKSLHFYENSSTDHGILISRPCISSNEISIFRDRSAAETEAAHDLLELSRSLPPLPPPSIAIGPQNVDEHPASDIQEISIYQSNDQPLYQVNTIDFLNSTSLYQTQTQHPHSNAGPPTGIIYEPSSLQHMHNHEGVFISLSPVQEILFYNTPTIPTSIIAQPLQSHIQKHPEILIQHQSQLQPQLLQQLQVQPILIDSTPPLTPSTSECSSDIENSNPNSQNLQPRLRDKEVQTLGPDEAEVKESNYTYDTLLITDGRSKNRKILPTQKHQQSRYQNKALDQIENVEHSETSRSGRYVCCECGKQYATSSNLSRHKQTHRSIDSQSAKKCIHCGKAYVSMPALAMHVLTHKLAHSCGICGKMFSRPWLLQGHLRSHTGEKPYGCAHCGKAFADRSNLRAHMQTHSTDKNYECSKCHKSFALKSYLNKHLESACQRDSTDDSSNDLDMIV